MPPVRFIRVKTSHVYAEWDILKGKLRLPILPGTRNFVASWCPKQFSNIQIINAFHKNMDAKVANLSAKYLPKTLLYNKILFISTFDLFNIQRYTIFLIKTTKSQKKIKKMIFFFEVVKNREGTQRAQRFFY